MIELPRWPFSADGKALASASIDPANKIGCVKVWSVTTGKEWGRFDTPGGYVWNLAIASDELSVATIHYNGTVTVWNLPPEFHMLSIEAHTICNAARSQRSCACLGLLS